MFKEFSLFGGSDDGLTIFTLRGLSPSSGTTTLVETLRRHSCRAWPAPRLSSATATTMKFLSLSSL